MSKNKPMIVTVLIIPFIPNCWLIHGIVWILWTKEKIWPINSHLRLSIKVDLSTEMTHSEKLHVEVERITKVLYNSGSYTGGRWFWPRGSHVFSACHLWPITNNQNKLIVPENWISCERCLCRVRSELYVSRSSCARVLETRRPKYPIVRLYVVQGT